MKLARVKKTLEKIVNKIHDDVEIENDLFQQTFL